MTEFIPSKKGDGYREVRTPSTDERALVAPHYVHDEGVTRVVYPAIGSTLCMLSDAETGGLQACLRLDHAAGPTSLLQVLNADELRAMGEGMIQVASEMEAAAADMLAAALKWKPTA